LNSSEFVAFASRGSSGDRPRVDYDHLKSFSVALPPLAEQHRIVSAIEEQFTRLDAAVAALARVRANLRRYRAAVLDAAVSGRLGTETEHVRTEPGELPTGWTWASLGELTARSEYGTSVKCTYEAVGPPVLRIPNISRGKLDLHDVKHSTAALNLDDSALQSGDLLICRTNGSID